MLDFNLSGNFTPMFFLISFLGGVLSSVSPCALGILPIIIGYVGISRENSAFRTILQILSLVLGLSLIMTVVGVFSALTGRVLIAVGGNYWVLFMASLILVFGLCLVGIIEINYPVIVKKMPKAFSEHPYIYPFIIGIMFALGTTPCSTPILAGIISYASLSTNAITAAIMLFLFSIGQGLILILAGLFTSMVKKMHNFDKAINIIVKLCGFMMIISAIYIYYRVFSVFFNHWKFIAT